MWTSLSKLSVVLETGQQSAAVSGADKIGVIISVQPTDDNGDPARVATEEWAGKVWLIDYVSETPLETTQVGNDWYCQARGEGGPAEKDGIAQFTYDVVRGTGAKLRTKSVGVAIKPTDSPTIIYSALNRTFHSSVMISVT